MRQEFCLNKRDSLLTVARLSPGFTAEALDRWQDREKCVHLPDFTNPAAAARAWAEQFEQRQAAEKQVALTAAKAEFLTTMLRYKSHRAFASYAKCSR